MSGNRPDFVFVRLSKHGEKIAGGHPLVVVAGRGQFEFKPGEPLEVTLAYDWNVVLRHERFDGEPLFELAPEDDASHFSSTHEEAKPEERTAEDAENGQA